MKKPKPNISENDITKAIIQYLELNKWHCFKIYNGGTIAGIFNGKIVYKMKDKKYAGVSDLICFNSKDNFPVLFLEIKKKGNYPSPEQKKFIELVKSSQNGWGEVCYSVDDVIKLINNLNMHFK